MVEEKVLDHGFHWRMTLGGAAEVGRFQDRPKTMQLIYDLR